jgi:hypothetical protein
VPGWPSRGPLIPFFAVAAPPGPVVAVPPAEFLPFYGATYSAQVLIMQVTHIWRGQD